MTLALTLLVLAQAQPPTTLAGTWELDPDASDDPGPMMEAMGVPTALKLLAPKKPKQTLAVSNGTVSVTANGLKGKRTEVFTLDGKTPNKADVMGIALELTSTLEGEVVVSRGTLASADGGRESLITRRSVSGDRMTVVTSIGSRQLKRVFRRLPP